MPIKSETRQVDRLLTNISVKYENKLFIAPEMFPKVSVKRTNDKYFIYERNFKLPETIRADKAKSREWTFEASTAAYSLEKHALKDYISQDDMDNYDQPDLRRDVTEELTDKIMLREEVSAAALFTTTSWSLNTSLAAAAVWSADTVASNPIPIWDTATSTILANSGFSANFSMLPEQSLKDVKRHQSILDRIKYTSSNVTEEMLKGLMGVEQLFIGKAQLDSAAEGVAASIGPVWNDFCFFGYKPSSASIRKPSFSYKFEKPQPTVRKWKDADREDAEAIEVQRQSQFKIVASLAGYMINNIR